MRSGSGCQGIRCREFLRRADKGYGIQRTRPGPAGRRIRRQARGIAARGPRLRFVMSASQRDDVRSVVRRTTARSPGKKGAILVDHDGLGERGRESCKAKEKASLRRRPGLGASGGGERQPHHVRRRAGDSTGKAGARSLRQDVALIGAGRGPLTRGEPLCIVRQAQSASGGAGFAKRNNLDRETVIGGLQGGAHPADGEPLEGDERAEGRGLASQPSGCATCIASAGKASNRACGRGASRPVSDPRRAAASAGTAPPRSSCCSRNNLRSARQARAATPAPVD